MNKEKLTLGSFKREGEPGSFQHYFKYVLEDGGEICLEACMNGYCVGRYNKNLELVGEKVCTDIEGMAEMQIAPGFSMGTGEAIEKAVEIANDIYSKINEVKEVECPDCGGRGWNEGGEAGHGCDGTEEDCARNCPVQVQIQVKCERCSGTGKIENEKNS